MRIPATIRLPLRGLPQNPGVYLMKDERGKVIYVGKATNLSRRVASYWRAQEALSRPQVGDLIKEVRTIEVMETPTVLEALILEANTIKKLEPKYNIAQKDAKSFLYLVITREEYPRPLFVRGHELEKIGKRRHKAVFGPYVQPLALRAALKLVRKIFPWSTCLPGQKRSCFDFHIGRCPGVCVGAVSKKEYAKIMRNVTLFFEGKKKKILRNLQKEMEQLAKAERFEEAAAVRQQIFSLEHIQDVAVLTRDLNGLFGHPRKEELLINIFGRIEGYDISNISGTSAVGSMVVFEDGEPSKKEYRRFLIKTVSGANDYAMLEEVLRRRFARVSVSEMSTVDSLPSNAKREAWPLPDLIMVDGGLGQVHVARNVMEEYRLSIPLVGIAKGIDRKKDELVFDHRDLELARIVHQYKEILVRLRDEAHRFAITYHRKVRGRRK